MESENRYYCQIKPVKIKNSVAEAELVNVWETSSSLELMLNSFTDSEELTLENYLIENGNKYYLLLNDTKNQLAIGQNLIIEIKKKQNQLLVNGSNIFDIDLRKDEYISINGNENLLASDGGIISCEYFVKGKYDCDIDEYIETIIESELQDKLLKKELKSKLRKIFFKFKSDEINENINNETIVEDFNITLSCFKIESFKVIPN